MSWLVICAVGGLGLYLLATAQEWVLRPRPDLREALRRLSVEGSYELAEERATSGTTPLYRLTLFERLLRPAAEDAGRVLARVGSHLGFGAEYWERKLRAAGQAITVPQYLGQKLIAGLVGFLFFPLANALDFTFSGPWPLASWIGGFAVGFVLPDWLVESRIRARRARIEAALPAVLALTSIAASAGMGIEQSLQVVSGQGEGPLLDELRSVVREAGLRRQSLAEGLTDLAEETGITELQAFAASVGSALTIGTQLGDSLRTQAESSRERRRLTLVAEGGRATAKMLLPVGFLILPAFFLVLVFPAAIQMLGLAG